MMFMSLLTKAIDNTTTESANFNSLPPEVHLQIFENVLTSSGASPVLNNSGTVIDRFVPGFIRNLVATTPVLSKYDLASFESLSLTNKVNYSLTRQINLEPVAKARFDEDGKKDIFGPEFYNLFFEGVLTSKVEFFIDNIAPVSDRERLRHEYKTVYSKLMWGLAKIDFEKFTEKTSGISMMISLNFGKMERNDDFSKKLKALSDSLPPLPLHISNLFNPKLNIFKEDIKTLNEYSSIISKIKFLDSKILNPHNLSNDPKFEPSFIPSHEPGSPFPRGW
jgi:hypothetical protein